MISARICAGQKQGKEHEVKNRVTKVKVKVAETKRSAVKMVNRELDIPVDLFARIEVIAQKRGLSFDECAVRLFAEAVRDKKFLSYKVPTPTRRKTAEESGKTGR